jgi:hypothetical protein
LPTKGERPEVFAIELQQVERLQDRLTHLAAAMQRVEDCNAIGTAQDRLPGGLVARVGLQGVTNPSLRMRLGSMPVR